MREADWLAGRIAETKQAIQRNEAFLRIRSEPSIEVTLRSFRKRLTRLEAEAATLATPPVAAVFPESAPAVTESNCVPRSDP